MSELRSAVEAIQRHDVTSLPDAQIEDELRELRRAIDQLEVEALRRVAVLDHRGVHARDGHLSTASWMADRLGVPWGVARRDVRAARALERMSATRKVLASGDLSMATARHLIEAFGEDPRAFERDERVLIDAAVRHDVRGLGKVLAYWSEQVASDAGLDPDARLHERRRLHASRTFMGMVRFDGTLDPEAGEVLLSAIGSVVDSEARRDDEDPRTPAQRRADALAEICRRWLDTPERPSLAGGRPHVNVTVDLTALIQEGTDLAARDGSGAGEHRTSSAELDRVGPISTEAARRIACDATVSRIVLGPSSQPIDVGRATAVVPPALRRAVVTRDRGCRFPGCDRPQTWCDAHHVRHWADGGPTSLANLVLLCRRHHRLVHGRRGFRVGLEDGRPVFRRPDGSAIADRAPP